jgi:hypothetical protein
MLSVYHIVRQVLLHDVGRFRVRGGRSFHLAMWMLPTFRLNNLTCKARSLPQPFRSILAHLLVHSLFCSPTSHPSSLLLITHYALITSPLAQLWRRTYLPLRSHSCPRAHRSRSHSLFSEPNPQVYGCEVGRLLVNASLWLTLTIRLCPTTTCSSKTRAEPN